MSDLHFKHYLFTLAVVALTAGCKPTTETSSFQVNCRFLPAYKDRLLVISNQEGAFLHQFNVAADSSTLQATLDLPLTEANLTLDYHLIDLQSQGNPLGSHLEISTWRGATSGEPTFLKSNYYYLYDDSPEKQLCVKILDGPAIQSAHFPAIYLSTDEVFDCCFDYDLEQKTFFFGFPPNKDLCVRVKPVGSEQYKIGIFNCQNLGNRDTLQLTWADFKDEVRVPLLSPPGQSVQGGISATLLASDRTVTLATNKQESTNGVAWLLVPEGWPVQDYAVYVQGQWTNAPIDGSRFFVSRHFEAGESLGVQQPDLMLQTAHFESSRFTVAGQGTGLDLIETRLEYTSAAGSTPRTGLWTIFSNATQPADYQLPPIGDLLEQAQRFPVEPPRHVVRLHRFDHYTPQEVQAGLPFLVIPNSRANAVEQTTVTFEAQ